MAVMAFLLIFCFALKLGWLPATGFAPLSDGLGRNLQSILLPAFSIALIEWVPLMRVPVFEAKIGPSRFEGGLAA